ncbi:hypothetical protein LC612_30110 [Nostoc sp. CHAB 5834]|nr:hypothetical protein [Nostoc sp. CHAB 5834]
MSFKNAAFSIVLALTACASAYAKDLGVQGVVWPILEIDMRQLMVESAAKANWSEAQAELKKSAETVLERLPKRQLPTVSKSRTVWVDPSIEINSDIQAPVKQSDGSYKWVVMTPKGTKVNPLEKYRPVTAVFLFDGSDPDQLALAKAALAKAPDFLVPMEAGSGDLKEDMEALGRPVFHANDGVISRFKVQYLPTLVYPGDGQYSLYIGVSSYAAPFTADEVLRSWPELANNAERIRNLGKQ